MKASANKLEENNSRLSANVRLRKLLSSDEGIIVNLYDSDRVSSNLVDTKSRLMVKFVLKNLFRVT